MSIRTVASAAITSSILATVHPQAVSASPDCPLHHPDLEKRLNVTDVIHERRGRRACKQEPDGVLVHVQDQASRVSAGRHVGGDDLPGEADLPATAVVDIHRRIDGRDPAGRVVGGPPGLLQKLTHSDARSQAFYVANPVDLAVQRMEVPFGDRGVDQIEGSSPRPVELKRNISGEAGDDVAGHRPAVVGAGLKDRVAYRGDVGVGQHVVVADWNSLRQNETQI